MRQKSFLRTSNEGACTGTIGSDAGTCCNEGEVCEPVEGNPAGNCCHTPGSGQVVCQFNGNTDASGAAILECVHGDIKEDFLGETCDGPGLGDVCQPGGGPAGNCCPAPDGGSVVCQYNGKRDANGAILECVENEGTDENVLVAQ